jgi:D-alanyl-D-alanine carboxypeptidase
MSQALGGGTAPCAIPVLIPPHGLDQIVATFGDIFDYIREDHMLDPRWQTEMLESVPLPFPILLPWDKSRSVRRISCHKLLAQRCAYVFAQIQNAGLQSKITSYGGCFSFRPQRTGTRLSAHAWGIALDLNPESNAQGAAGNMDASVIAIFKGAGFTWGGDWQGRICDPMHFQFCTGY